VSHSDQRLVDEAIARERATAGDRNGYGYLVVAILSAWFLLLCTVALVLKAVEVFRG
jgi:hypothetical protein